MAGTLELLDEVATGPCGGSLAAWVAHGTTVGTTPVRCPATDGDAAAHQRLDLALRMLRGQPPSQWCREADAATVVVRRWQLPARGLSLLDADGHVTAMVLAVGRPGGEADVWRFRFDVASTAVLDRGRELLPT